MSKYSAPEWEALTANESQFYIEVLKDGSIVDTILLNERTHYIFGRQPDICHVQLDHPSISRQHAAVVHSTDGTIMLIDLHSAQGTIINKTMKCEVDTCYRLFVGDLVRFGTSSRQYIICGPDDQMRPEYDSANMQEYRKRLVSKSEREEKKRIESESAGISWGFDEDAVNYDDEVDDEDVPGSTEDDKVPSYLKNDENYDRKYGKKFSTDLKDTEVHEKDRAILDKIRVKERKIQNMQEETR